MGENTKIEWATHTFNPWLGCYKVSPACEHCYAEDMMDHRYGRVRWGAGEDRIRTSTDNWRKPLKWNKSAEAAGRIDTVFCLSLGDIWDNEVDPLWRRDAFELMERTPHLLYLLLSKRIGNAIKMCAPAGDNCLPTNCALGSTMVTQEEWDRDLPKLKEATRALGARLSFASVEPMLGPINAGGKLPDWVIVGGESGPHARPMHPDWPRLLRDQCAAAGVPFFFKQWGEYEPAELIEDDPELRGAPWRRTMDGGQIWEVDELKIPREQLAKVDFRRVGKTRAGRLLDGRTHDAMPTGAGP